MRDSENASVRLQQRLLRRIRDSTITETSMKHLYGFTAL